jgi:hypothetical protein
MNKYRAHLSDADQIAANINQSGHLHRRHNELKLTTEIVG